jgi:hypothetical protein
MQIQGTIFNSQKEIEWEFWDGIMMSLLSSLQDKSICMNQEKKHLMQIGAISMHGWNTS